MSGRPRIRQAPDRAWMARAACRGRPSDMFFPQVDERKAKGIELYGIARRVCAGCPVRPDCLEYALANREYLGMWGGLTPAERRALQQARVRRAEAQTSGVLVDLP